MQAMQPTNPSEEPDTRNTPHVPGAIDAPAGNTVYIPYGRDAEYRPRPFAGSPAFFGLLIGGVLLFAAACGIAVLTGLGTYVGTGLFDIPDQDPELNPYNQPLTTGVKVGSLAPDFTLTDVYTGDKVTLSSLRGRPVWINFWATWCPPCKEEMPEMQRLYEQHKDKGLVILGVDLQESVEDVKRYTTEGGFKWTFLIDDNGEVTNRYLVQAIPSHFFVDRGGVIRAAHLGGLKNAAGLKAPVDEYLNRILKP